LWIARGKNSSHGTLQAFNAALRHEPFSSHYSTMLFARALSKSLGLLALDDSPSGVAVGKEAGGLHEFACVRRWRCARRRLNGFCLHFDLPLHWFGASGGFAGGAQTGGGGACRLCAAAPIGKSTRWCSCIEGDFDWTELKGSTHGLLANIINTDTQ